MFKNRISQFLDSNELILNLKKNKTESILFGTPKRLAGTKKEFEVVFRYDNVSKTDRYVYLGNIVDPSRVKR